MPRFSLSLGHQVAAWILSCMVCLWMGWHPQPALALQLPRHYSDLTFPPLPEVTVPDPQRVTLNNGLVVYLLEDHELPLVQGTVLMRTGSRYESQVGVADLMGVLLRGGGTRQHTATQLDQRLEARAAVIESSMGLLSGSLQFSCLSEDLPFVVDQVNEILREPVFAQDRLDFFKSQYRSQWERRNDQPGQILNREFAKLMYGSSSPYARTLEPVDLKAITRKDIQQFYQRWIHPNGLIVGIIGDFNSDQVIRQLQQGLGTWPKDPALGIPTPPPVSASPAPGIYFINRPELTQSYILLGQLGGTMRDPDYFTLTVMNELLNGLGGRLVQEVRSRQGLAYSVYGFWSAGFDYPGLFVAGGETRSATTVAMIEGIRQEIRRLRQGPISAEELQRAKDSVLNSFVFNFEDPAQTLFRLMRYEFFDLPRDFIFQYQRGIAATTVADIERVARQYLLDPAQLTLLVVGQAEAIDPPLSQLGSVQPVTIDSPE